VWYNKDTELKLAQALRLAPFVFSCQDPKVDDFFVSYSFGWEYKVVKSGGFTPLGLIF
jgi:hypothetical protein